MKPKILAAFVGDNAIANTIRLAAGWRFHASAMTPAGSDTQVQFNDGGSVGADAALVWDKANNRLGVGGAPGAPLDVQPGTAAVGARVRGRTDVAAGHLQFTDAGATTAWASVVASAASLVFNQSAAQRMALSSSGVTIGPTTATPIAAVLSGTATWDPASVAVNASAQTTVTVAGVATGGSWACFASLSTLTTQRMVLGAAVSAANTVTVTLHNDNNAAIDLGSGTLRAVCFGF